jgi:hypothetical protein
VKRLSALCLVFLVALAGCTGGGGDPTTTPSTPTPIDGDAPPGVTATDIDTDTLVSAHLDALDNRSYTITVEQSSGGNSISVTSRAEAGRLPALIDVEGQGAIQEVYVTTNASYELRQGGGEQTIRRTQENASTIPTGERYVRQVLADGNLSYTGTVERDGRTLHRLRAGLPDLNRQIEDGRATWFEAELLVDESGLVHSLSYRLTVERDGTESDLRIEMDLTDIGATTVDEPSWIDDASTDPNATTRTLSNSGLETTLAVAGSSESVSAVTLENASTGFYNLSVVEDARVSPLATMNASETISLQEIRMEYDTEAIPEGNASGLFVFVYHPDYGTFLPMETSYDPDNETVQATRIDPDITIDGESEPPTLDSISGEFVFVTMHGQTYWDGLEEQSND